MFKNMKIRAKLITGFLLVVIVALVLGVVSIFGLTTLSNNETGLYEEQVQAIYNAEEIEIALHQQRASFYDLYVNKDDDAKAAELQTQIDDEQAALESALDAYVKAVGEDTYSQNLQNIYDQQYAPLLNQFQAQIEANEDKAALETLEKLPDVVAAMETAVTDMVNNSLTTADETQATDTSLANTIIIITIILAVVVVVGGIFLALYNTALIATPTQQLVKAANQISKGDLNIDIKVDQKDEIGTLADAFKEMANAFREQASVLTAIAGGDYTGSIAVRSEADEVNRAISDMLDSNNAMIAEIRSAAEQVAAGASQIADGAQALATGSTEQAATLQEFSATINQVQQQAEATSQLAATALADTDEAGRLMGESMEYMSQMTDAMQTINDSSQNIAKVIKVIDDIAFQTNILALNAAVEAARAGQHGKGFAVVADEVRNLASKSAAAAKETAGLIENSVENVTRGTQIAEHTSESLAKVGTIAASNAQSIGQMSEASQQQSIAINEINQGVSQISQVVQANSATAEESAASAEELSAQSTLLNKTVTRFKLRSGVIGSGGHNAYEAPSASYPAPPALPPQSDMGGGDYLF